MCILIIPQQFNRIPRVVVQTTIRGYSPLLTEIEKSAQALSLSPDSRTRTQYHLRKRVDHTVGHPT